MVKATNWGHVAQVICRHLAGTGRDAESVIIAILRMQGRQLICRSKNCLAHRLAPFH